MGSRIRPDCKHIFDCFLEVVCPPGNSGVTVNETEAASPWILQTYPPEYKDKHAERLKAVPPFVFPCKLEIVNVQNFSFVLTNVDAQWTFGFCRHAPNSQTALVLLSSLPWHETFYRLLNHAAELLALSTDDGELWRFLEACHRARVPDPGCPFHVSWTCSGDGDSARRDFTCQTPRTEGLPNIPENRNLTEYYNAVGVHNMLVVFASMLFERRIVVTSRRLSRLSACVQAANALLYPMHWQHIFIPVLPKHLVDYLSAPMPFLIGVPAPIMQRVKQHELGEAVILDADSNVIKSPFTDLEALPFEVAANLKRSLKNHKDLLGESVARAFLQALVHLIGGYRDALKFRQGEKITFCEDAFVNSRSPSLQPFLEQMLQLQIFRQFVEERLHMLNTGKGFTDEFEMEAVRFQEKVNNNSRLKHQYAQISSSVKKEGGAIVKAVKSKVLQPRNKKAEEKERHNDANPAVKSAVRGLQHRSKAAYRDVRSKMKGSASNSQLSGSPIAGSSFASTPPALARQQSSSSAPSSPVLAEAGRRALSISSASSGSSASHNAHSSAKGSSAADLLSSGRGQLRYERFDPPHLSGVPRNHSYGALPSSSLASIGHLIDDSPEMEEPRPLDLDLMDDLRDVLFQNDKNDAPPINRHLKPSLRRSNATAASIFYAARPVESGVSNQQGVATMQAKEVKPEAVAGGSSYENLYRMASSSDESDDPFSTDHVRLHDSPTPHPEPQRKPSAGDLIKFGGPAESQEEVIFDPLLQDSRQTSLLPQPPSTSTLPQMAQLFEDEPNVRQSVNNPPVHRQLVTKSSDDLLRSYGLDFTKLSTTVDSLSNKGSGSSAGKDEEEDGDLLASLDPLSSSSGGGRTSVSALARGFEERSSPSPLPRPQTQPVAPPRTRRQQNWTTFD